MQFNAKYISRQTRTMSRGQPRDKPFVETAVGKLIHTRALIGQCLVDRGRPSTRYANLISVVSYKFSSFPFASFLTVAIESRRNCVRYKRVNGK